MPAKSKRKAEVEESVVPTQPAKRTRKSAAAASTPAPNEKPAKKAVVKSKAVSTKPAKPAKPSAKTTVAKTKKASQKAAVSNQSEKSTDRSVKQSAKAATESTNTKSTETPPVSSPVDLSSITNPLRKFEVELTQKLGPSTMVFGVDEAGRGPLAGPVVAACCYVPLDVDIAGVRDSKDIVDEAERETIYEELIKHPRVRWAAHVNSHERIDEINILQATMESMCQAARSVKLQPNETMSYLLIDGNRLPKDLPAEAQAVVKGDALVYNIAAASVIAKVTRDRIMHQLHLKYPQYDFAQHKGYGVPAHVAAIYKHGPSPIHRKTFAPVKHMLGIKKVKK